MTTNIERAAEVIRWIRMDVGRREGNYPSPEEMARALADAGLLVTDEIQAIVDAAIKLKRFVNEATVDYIDRIEVDGVVDAVHNYLASKEQP